MTPAPVQESTPIARSRSAFRTVLGSVCVAAILVGCGSSGDNKPGSGANIVLTNANNYKSSSTLALSNVDTVSGQDIEIRWDAVTKDLQCHDVVPTTDIKSIGFVTFVNKTQQQAQVELISGELSASSVVYRDFKTPGGTTKTTLSTVARLGSDTQIVLSEEYVQNATTTYVLIASGSTTPGAGARSMIFVTPKSDGTNTVVDIPEGCGDLTFTANLHDLTKVSVPAKGPWVADWTQVTKDSEDKDPSLVTKKYDLILAHYDKSITEIEADFFNIETTATKLWRIRNIEGSETTSKNLGQAQAADGSLFTGFEPADGIWALGLQCPDCQNPAPMFLTILEPGGA